jgi:UDP-N-acetylglucosamine--N-acetylmuramyl-(pentapeptide) pyrophosphoryl-undecaprenol N-acetylglucosamine transferase
MEMQKYLRQKLKDFGFQDYSRLTFDNALFQLKLLSSIVRTIIKQFKPDVVIGTGGLPSGPLLQM